MQNRLKQLPLTVQKRVYEIAEMAGTNCSDWRSKEYNIATTAFGVAQSWFREWSEFSMAVQFLKFNTGGINMESDILDVILKTGGTLASGAVRGALFRIFRHVILNQPDHVIERVFNSFSSAQEYNDKKLQCGETLRGDWYYDNDNNVKFAEDMVRQTISDTQGKKSEYITKFHVNIRFSSNDDIDEHTAFSYLETMESLSWRQLCMIRLIALCDDGEVDIRHIHDEDVEQMPQDEQTRFYSIGREYEKLKDARYIQSTEIGRSEENNERSCLAQVTDGFEILHANYIH